MADYAGHRASPEQPSPLAGVDLPPALGEFKGTTLTDVLAAVRSLHDRFDSLTGALRAA